jgi:hypothetical protein
VKIEREDFWLIVAIILVVLMVIIAKLRFR